MFFVFPQLLSDAIRKLGSRSPVASTLTSDQWSEIPVELRERAFFSATVESLRFLDNAQGMIGEYLTSETTSAARTGETMLKTGGRAQFIEALQQFAVSSGMGPLDPAHAGGLRDIRSETRLALIFDTQVQSANDYGYWKQGMDPDILNEFPAQRFIRAIEVQAPRADHQTHQGDVRRKDDLEYWRARNANFGVPWGPWGFRSGMDVEDVDRAEAEAVGLVNPGEDLAPVDRAFNDELKASTTGLSSSSLDRLQRAFGDQITVDGDSVRWTPKTN